MTFTKQCLLFISAAALLPAQTAVRTNVAPPLEVSPYRLEIGGYGIRYANRGGWWRGVDSTLWIRRSRKFVPAFTFDNRTTDFATQRSYSFFSYANWTPNFYTTQAVSGSPVSPGPQLFPRFRYDLKAWWKLPPHRRVVVGLGATRYSFAGRQAGLLINPGILYYKGSWVFNAEGFANRTSPGGLWSASGLFAVQQGREGKRWTGISIGAGRQVYRAVESTPFNVRLATVSADVFYRRWLTRRTGFVVSPGYQHGTGGLSRWGITFHLFFEF